MRLAIVGAGSFGTSLAEQASRCGNEVLLWAHDPAVGEAMRRTRSNPVYLPAATLSPQVEVTSSLEEIARYSDTVVMVTPSHHARHVLEELNQHLSSAVRVVSATKGIENESLMRISEIAQDVLGERLAAFACLSGPTFALEVSRGDPTAAVIASKDERFALDVQERLSSRSFRLYHTDDVVGVEIAGSLKNVIAIAAGVIDGVGYGSNTMAALVTRGLHEMRKLGLRMGGRAETFAGLAGMGDLVLTCTGSLSRNRSVGVQLGEGKSLEQILAESRLVAEGVKTCRSARATADRHDVEMPIIFEMYRLLYEKEDPRNAIERLMTRTLKSERIEG